MEPLTVLLLVLGFGLLIGGAEWLVRGAAGLATASGISPLVVGLTVVAFGTSAPELAVSLQAAVEDRAGLAIGNIIGSNICNVLLILGTVALITPLVVERQLIRRDVPLMVLASLALYGLVLDGRLSEGDGLLLFAGVLVYTVDAIRRGRRAGAAEQRAAVEAADGGLLKNLGLLVVGLLMLVLGARWLVAGAVDIARYFQLSELVIGLTVVALGTSLPELAASVVACRRGRGEIAVGNAVGSNLFNILSVLGLTAILSPSKIPVTDAALRIDMPVMIVTAVACLPIFFTGYRIDRWEGGLFLGFYLLYIVYLFMTATEHEALGAFGVMMLFVLPLTLITLAVLAWRYWASRRR